MKKYYKLTAILEITTNTEDEQKQVINDITIHSNYPYLCVRDKFINEVLQEETK